jgi:hypothetical protein
VNDIHKQAIRDLTEALDHPLLLERSLGDRLGIAAALADRLIELGWTPPGPSPVKEEWRPIPGCSAFEASNKGFIRHSISKVWVPISAILGEIQPVVLYDDNGRDVPLEYQQIMDTTWPRETT